VHSLVAFGSLGLPALALLAFWPNYLAKPLAPIDGYTHFHAATGLLWLVLLLAQALLVRARRLDLHRFLGRLSFAAAPLFVLSSLLLAHHRFSRMDAVTFEREACTLYLPLSAALLFACAWALALAHRRDIRLHARFMASTGLLLLDPVVGRVLAFHVVQRPEFWNYQLATFGVAAAVVLALARTLPPRSQPRLTFAVFAGGYVSVLAGWFFVPHSPAWNSFAQWFRGLAVT
jgi:uncharacterized membrane protein